MRKLISTVMAIFLALSLIGCAGTSQNKEARVKCPACGYTGLAPIYQPDESTK